MPLALHSKDGASKDLWNVDTLPQHYAASQSRRIWLEYSLAYWSIWLCFYV